MIAGVLVLDKKAIAQLVRFSPVFRERFARNVHRMHSNPTKAKKIKDLASAKHRFDSHARPLARASLYLEALLNTAQQIYDERGPRSPEGESAGAFLEMMGDEAPALVRTPPDAD